MKGPILRYLSADFYYARIYINEFPSQIHQSKIQVKIAIQTSSLSNSIKIPQTCVSSYELLLTDNSQAPKFLKRKIYQSLKINLLMFSLIILKNTELQILACECMQLAIDLSCSQLKAHSDSLVGVRGCCFRFSSYSPPKRFKYHHVKYLANKFISSYTTNVTLPSVPTEMKDSSKRHSYVVHCTDCCPTNIYANSSCPACRITITETQLA